MVGLILTDPFVNLQKRAANAPGFVGDTWLEDCMDLGALTPNSAIFSQITRQRAAEVAQPTGALQTLSFYQSEGLSPTQFNRDRTTRIGQAASNQIQIAM